MSRKFALAAATFLCGLPIAASAAALLHWPLPADSTERNGAPQILQSHRVVHGKSAAPPMVVTPDVGGAVPYSGKPVDVLNYHYDTYPTGWNRSETDLTPASVASAKFVKLKTLKVDGNVFAQPLLATGITLPDGSKHDVLIVATGHNSVYAYDAANYTLLWQVSLGTPQSTADVGCGDVQPEYGISSTPVIVRSGAAATLYLVAATEPAPFSFHTQLHALDLATGKDTLAPTEIAPQVTFSDGQTLHFDPQNQWNRSSLVAANGSIYFGIGSHCDNNAGSISGWMLRYRTSDLGLARAFNTIRAPADLELASIWMSGFPAAVDESGNVLAVTGNGNFSRAAATRGFGESILSLSGDLSKVNGAFTPSNWSTLNGQDQDFGSGGVMVVPTVAGQASPPLAIAAGKFGTAYVVDATKLGGGSPFGSKPLATIVPGQCWCAPAYANTGGGGVIYYQGSSDVLRAYSVDVSTATPVLKQIGSGSVTSTGPGGSFPVVSTNGSTPGTGVVWLLHHGDTMQLEAYDATKLGAPLATVATGRWSNGSRGYLTPLVANGRVYAPAYKTVTVFGLTR